MFRLWFAPVFLFVTLAVGLLGEGQAIAQDARTRQLQVDTSRSYVAWTGRKVTGHHTGKVQLNEGTVLVDGEEIRGGNFSVDLSTIVDEDLQDPAYNKKLTDHLKSADFFNIAQFPRSTFTISHAERIAGAAKGAPNYNVSGDLTIRGVSQPVSFPAIIEKDGDYAVARATLKLDRTLWNLRYGSGKFFAGLGDKLIYDEFSVDVVVAAKL